MIPRNMFGRFVGPLRSSPTNMKKLIRPSMEIHDGVLPTVLLASLLDMWKSNVMCDVVLSVGGKEMQAHKIVLVAASPYFRGMFSVNLKEAQEHRVEMHDTEFQTLYDIINFLYSTELLITEENVFSLLTLSDILQLTSVRSACSQFVLENLTVSSCLSTLHYTHLRPDYKDVTSETLKYTWNNMTEIMKEDDFVLLSPDIMKLLMEGRVINVADEGVLLSGILEWISHSPQERLQYLEELAGGIQLTHVPTLKLLPFKQHPLLQGTQLLDWINKTFDSRLEERLDSGEARCTWAINFTERRRTLRYAETDDVILAIGGESGGSALSTMDSFYPKDCYWRSVIPKVMQSSKGLGHEDRVIATMQEGRSGAAVAYSDDKIVVVGGTNLFSLLDSVETYSIEKNEWKGVVPLPIAVIGAQCAFMNGQLYVTGGYSYNGIEKRCWVFDESMTSCTEFASMNSPRCFHGLVCIAGFLYAIGGRVESKRNSFEGRLLHLPDNFVVTNSMERYDPILNIWVKVCPMITPRSDFGYVTVERCIYAICGFKDNSWIDLCEKYDPKTNSWKCIARCPDQRSSFGVAVSKGVIYILGGYDGMRSSSDVKKYNTVTDRWHSSVGMQNKRISLGAAVARIPIAMSSAI